MFDGLSVSLVSTTRGNLAFGLTDLYLQGRMPIVFQRSYISDRREDIGLGVGWSFVFADRINIEGDAATLTDINGPSAFQRDGQSQSFSLQANEPGIHQQLEMADAETIIERAGDVTRTYKKIGEAYCLSQITGPGDISARITHDAAGKVIRVSGDPGGSLTYQWTEGKNARLLAVVPLPDAFEAESDGRAHIFSGNACLVRAKTAEPIPSMTSDATPTTTTVSSEGIFPASRICRWASMRCAIGLIWYSGLNALGTERCR